MKYFTPEDALLNYKETFSPREQTLDFIRQVAYSYNKNVQQTYDLN